MIWIIPAVIAALSLFKLGSLYVWLQVMAIALRVLVAVCVLLAGGMAAVVFWRRRRQPS